MRGQREAAASIPQRGGTTAAQRERAVGTRAKLITVARSLFAEVGFYATGTNEIVARAAVTRGALYHHFTDKEELFEAVFLEATADLDRQGRAAVASWSGDLWSKMKEAFTSHLRLVASSREFQRILLIDGPAVLGWARWREIQSQYVASDTAQALRDLMDQRVVPKGPASNLAYLIQAALNDAALSIAHAAESATIRKEATEAFIFLLEGLKRETGNGRGRKQSACRPIKT